jgi:hypothetical protein
MIFENFVEERKYSLLWLINLQCQEIWPNKKQIIHFEFMYIPLRGEY